MTKAMSKAEKARKIVAKYDGIISPDTGKPYESKVMVEEIMKKCEMGKVPARTYLHNVRAWAKAHPDEYAALQAEVGAEKPAKPKRKRPSRAKKKDNEAQAEVTAESETEQTESEPTEDATAEAPESVDA